MILLPLENKRYLSGLNPDDLKARIEDLIEDKKYFNSPELNVIIEYKPHEGNFDGSVFRMSPKFLTEDAYRPLIRGTLVEDDEQSKIKLMVTLTPTAISLTLSVFLFLGILYYVTNFNILVILAILIFVYAICLYSFKSQSSQSIKYLEQLLDLEKELEVKVKKKKKPRFDPNM